MLAYAFAELCHLRQTCHHLVYNANTANTNDLPAGAGKAEGAMDAANLLKPALARGELRCIGATTLAEYRQHIEKDAAFERRFQQVREVYC